MVNVTFWGVRGSTPCPCEANRRYGGNTACVTIDAPGMAPIVLDLGTGLRFYGDALLATAEADDPPFQGLALVTHLHWDHIQGLPFFVPIHRPGSSLLVCGRDDEGSLKDAFDEFMRPPFFPVRPSELGGDITFRDVNDETFEWGRAVVTVGDVPHTGATNGYRIEIDGVVIVYVSDHQQPDEGHHVSDSVAKLCHEADLVIHDAQYEHHEFASKVDWGHCTVEYAVQVAAHAGAKRLALFHHDPAHDDDTVDRMLLDAQRHAMGTSVTEVIGAAEGLTVALGVASPAPVV